MTTLPVDLKEKKKPPPLPEEEYPFYGPEFQEEFRRLLKEGSKPPELPEEELPLYEPEFQQKLAAIYKPPEALDLSDLLRKVFPQNFQAGYRFGIKEKDLPQLVWEQFVERSQKDPEGLTLELRASKDLLFVEEFLRRIQTPEEVIKGILYPEPPEPSELETLVSKIPFLKDYSLAEVGDLIDNDPEGFIDILRTGGRTKDKQDLLLALGASWDDINEVFAIQRVRIPVDDVWKSVTVTQDGRAFDENGRWVGSYNTITQKFEALPEESKGKDVIDTLRVASTEVGHQITMAFTRYLPLLLFPEKVDPIWRKVMGDAWADLKEARNAELRNFFRRISSAGEAERTEWVAKHPELQPRKIWDEGVTKHPELFKDPWYWVNEFARTAPLTLATMATTIGVTAVAGPGAGILAGMAIMTPAQITQTADAFMAHGASEDKAALLGLVTGSLMSLIEVAGDLPMFKMIAPRLFGKFRENIVKEAARVTMGSLAGKGLKTFGIVEITETLEEVFQQAIQNAVTMTIDENQALFEGLSETTIRTMMATAPLGLFGAGVAVRPQIRQAVENTMAQYPELKTAGALALADQRGALFGREPITRDEWAYMTVPQKVEAVKARGLPGKLASGDYEAYQAAEATIPEAGKPPVRRLTLAEQDFITQQKQVAEHEARLAARTEPPVFEVGDTLKVMGDERVVKKVEIDPNGERFYRVEGLNQRVNERQVSLPGVTPPAAKVEPTIVDLTSDVEAAHSKLSSLKARNSLTASKALDKLEAKGIDVEDARDSLDNYKSIERSDFDSAEEFAEARTEAWDEFLDSVDGIDASEIEQAAKEVAPPVAKPTAETAPIEVAGKVPEAVTPAAAKEPWQMTRVEWKQAVLADSPEYAQRSQETRRMIDRGHRESVQQALSEGKPVPPEVLAEYPDLVAKGKPPVRAEAAKVEPPVEVKAFDWGGIEFHSNISPEMKQRLEEWASYLPVDFKKYVERIQVSEKLGTSFVGKEGVKGVIYIQPGLNNPETFFHEIGHAMGLFSEEEATTFARGILAKMKPPVEGKPVTPPPGPLPGPPPVPPPPTDGARKVYERIEFEPEHENFMDKIRRGWHRFNVTMVEELFAIKQLVDQLKKGGVDLSIEENPYLTARLLKGIMGKANVFLETGTFGKKFWKMEKGKAVPNFTGESLETILQEVKDPQVWRDFSTYLVARRTVQLAGRKIETGITLEDAQSAISELEAKYGNFSSLADRVYKYQDSLLVYANEMGLVSNELLEKLRKFGDYVPFYRVMNELQAKGLMGKKLANIAQPIKKIKGSEREIINPLESIVKNTYVIINSADRNQVGIMLANLADRFPQVTEVFERIKTPVARVAGVTAKELGVEIKGMTEADAEAIIDIFRPSFFTRGDEVTVLINGKKQYFKVDPDLRNALLNLDAESLGMLGKILGAPARWLRAGATLSPDFMARNPARDQLTAFAYSEYGFIPGIDFIRGLASVIAKDADYQLYRASGAEHAMLVSMDRNYLQKTFKEIVEGRNFTFYVKHPMELLRIVSELGEKATRLGEFKAGIRRGATPLEAGYSSRVVTLDFSQMGTTARALNNLIAFFNANVRGWGRMVSSFKEHPIRTSAKVFMGITMPSILLYMVNRDDERWKEIPQWQKDLFWIVFVGDNIYRIPKPFELGIIFGSMPERFLEWLDNKNPEMLEEAMATLIEAGSPGFIPTAGLPILEWMTNYSFFRGTKLVPASREKMPPELQYLPYTSEFSKKIGELIKQPPAKIDNLINGYTAGLGRYAVDGLDGILKGTGIVPDIPEPSPTLADRPVIKAFVVRNPYGSSGATVERFYDTLAKFEQGEKYLKEMLELGNEDKFEKFKADHPELLFFYQFPDDPEKKGVFYSATARYLRRVARDLTELRKKQDAIYTDKVMSPEKKRQLIDEIDVLKTEVAQKALNLFIDQPQVLQNSINEAINRLGEVIEDSPVLSLIKPDIFDMRKLYTEFGGILEAVKLEDLSKLEGIDPLAHAFLETKQVKKEVDLLLNKKIYEIKLELKEGVTFENYYQSWKQGIFRNKDFESLPRRQLELLVEFNKLDKPGQTQFLKDYPELNINPTVAWLKSHPKENAQLAIWGQAKILTIEAYNQFKSMIKELDIPDKGISEMTLPPEGSIDNYFKFQDIEHKTSWEAQLILAKDPDLLKFLERQPIDSPVAALELKVKHRKEYDQIAAYGDKDSPDYITNNKKREEKVAQFKKDDKTGFVDDTRRIEAYENEGEEHAELWVEKGRIADQKPGFQAEEKLWLVDNPKVWKWALDKELAGDNGSDWNVPAMRIEVKWREEERTFQAIDPEWTNPETGQNSREEYLAGVGLTGEALATRIEYRKDRRRREAYQLVPLNAILLEEGKQPVEIKAEPLEELPINLIAIENELRDSVKVHASRSEWDKKWEQNYVEMANRVAGIKSGNGTTEDLDFVIKLLQEDKELDETSARYFREQGDDQKALIYEGAARKWEGFILQLQSVWATISKKPGKKLVLPEPTMTIPPSLFAEKYVEYYELPKKGYYQERYLLEYEDFASDLKILKGVDLPDPNKVPAVEYDQIYQENKSDFDLYEQLPEADKKVFWKDEEHADFRVAKTARDAYYILAGKEKYVPSLVAFRLMPRPKEKFKPTPDILAGYEEWKKLPDTEKARDSFRETDPITYGWIVKMALPFYDDDWFLIKNQDFYETVYLGVLENDKRDFSKVPTREVFAKFEAYLKLPERGKTREVFRRANLDLDAWLVLKFGYTPITAPKKGGAKKGGTVTFK